ncbi:hypothetical protein BJY04DRAFT_175793 [Aspergillus karnatakaensis]|uniref:uncharacterized protein n=1 Tax=Aspergillus karnatakaensis TaxID=1810916 RepID=UPI003CCD64BF
MSSGSTWLTRLTLRCSASQRYSMVPHMCRPWRVRTVCFVWMDTRQHLVVVVLLSYGIGASVDGRHGRWTMAFISLLDGVDLEAGVGGIVWIAIMQSILVLTAAFVLRACVTIYYCSSIACPAQEQSRFIWLLEIVARSSG